MNERGQNQKVDHHNILTKEYKISIQTKIHKKLDFTHSDKEGS